MKISPIAKYITENKLSAVKDGNITRLYNKAGEYSGFIRKKHIKDFSIININLYRSKEDHPFLKQLTLVNRSTRYFLSEKKYMPIRFETKKILTDYDKKIVYSEELGRGLAQDRYISEIQPEGKISGIPNDRVYKINKLPFKYEFKYHLYQPNKHISEVAFDKNHEAIK